MSQNFTNSAGTASANAKADPNKTKTLDADDMPLQDEEHSYHSKLFIGFACATIGLFCNIFQVFSSTLGFALIASFGVFTLSTFKPSPLWWCCLFLAFIVQGFLHKFALSSKSTWDRLRAIRIHGIKGIMDKDMYQEAFSIVASMNTLYLLATIVCDVAGDSSFASSLSSNGMFIAMMSFMPTGGSTALFYHGITMISGAIQDARDYESYLKKYHDVAK